MSKGRTNYIVPNFLIIGAQRCATGWISECLREHPDIFVARDETRFFDHYYERGLEWWVKTYFRAYKGESAVGEKTANYIYDPEVPARIAGILPEVKLICCLRDPVERMYSAYLHQRRQNKKREPLTFLEAVNADRELVQRGLYFEQIKRILTLYPRDRLLVKFYEDKLVDPVVFIQDIYGFLNVNKCYVPLAANVQTKPGSFEERHRLLFAVARLLLYRHSPLKPVYSNIRKRYMKGIDVYLDENSVVNLRKHFDSDIRELEQLTGRDLSCWVRNRWKS